MKESCTLRAAALTELGIGCERLKVARRFCCSSCGRMRMTQFSHNPELLLCVMLAKLKLPPDFQTALGGNVL